MRVLVACEESQTVCEAFRAWGHDAFSCDLKECSGGHPEWHIVGDAIEVAHREAWDLMIAHPPCTRLANSGVRWLTDAPPTTPPEECTEDEKQAWSALPTGVKFRIMWRLFDEGVSLYTRLRDVPIPKKCIENPVMHGYAKEEICISDRQVVQPHWFGDPMFKATGYELFGLEPLKRTHWMDIPEKDTEEYKAWSWVHRLPPSPDRATLRSRTPKGIARAMAAQWGFDPDNILD